jgi:flagellar motor switch protein FliM
LGDILSQNEIDDLLKALNSGEIDVQEMNNKSQVEKKLKVHDFRRPSKFAKDHLKTLNIIYENYARLLNNYLSGYLRTLVQIEVLSVEPLTFYEFNNSISNPAVLAIVDFSPLTGSIICEISPNIAFAIIDRILGGKGNGIDKVRGFTEVELVLVERLAANMIGIMKEPWETIAPIRPRLEKVETNVQFAQLISPNEIIALITLSTRVGETEGMINICIPHLVVEPIVSKLSTRFWFSMIEKESNEENKHSIKTKIEKTFVPIKAILGRTSITVMDFMELRVGDVLPLDSNINNDIEIHLGNLLKFYGKPGVKKNKVSIKITDVILREGD